MAGSGYRRSLKTQGGGTDENFRAQSNIESFVSPLARTEILNGVLLENIVVTTVATEIQHKLGRKARGFILVKSNAAVTLHSPTDSSRSDLFEIVQSTGNATVSLWFF